MSTIQTSTPLDLGALTDALVLPIDEDLRGIYSPGHGVLHIIDIDSGIALESFVKVADASSAADIIRSRYI